METGKIAIAKVVIRSRQHLAAVKPQEKGLMLELMHFPKELIDISEFKEPAERTVGKAEMKMARQLIDSMTSDWEPDQYNDEYHEALEKLIEEKIEHPDQKTRGQTRKLKPTKVIDLVAVLQESLQHSKSKPPSGKKKAASTPKTRRAAPQKKAA